MAAPDEILERILNLEINAASANTLREVDNEQRNTQRLVAELQEAVRQLRRRVEQLEAKATSPSPAPVSRFKT